MKKIKYILVLLIFGFYSCSDYLDINDNPNQLHSDQAKPDQYLPAAQVACYSVQASTMNRLGLLFSNATGGNVQTYAAPFSSEFNFNVTSNFYSGIFQSIYLNVNTFQKIIDFPDTTGQYMEYKAIAKICKAYYMQYIVDLYGNAPYTEAFKGIDNVTPKYEDDQLIYKHLLTELDEARALISTIQNNPPSGLESSATSDMMLGGDLSKWNKFANTIELKMLVRMSTNTGAVASWRDTRLSNLNPDFISEDVTIQPGYSAANNSQLNPFVSAFGWDAAGNVTSRNVYCISGHLAKCLNGLADINYASAADKEVVAGSGVFYPLVVDPRRYNLFAKSAAGYHKGVTQGSTTVDVYKPGGSSVGQPSKFAPLFFNPYNNIGLPLSGTVNTTTLPNTGTGNYLDSSKGYVMTLAEANFLQAEAGLLGDNGVGTYSALNLNVQTAYNSGVTNSFLMNLLTSANATTYIGAISSKPNFGYNTTNSYAQNYNAILYQKYVALLNTNAIEAYISNTKTSKFSSTPNRGYPLFPMPLGAPVQNRPYRLIYPTSEYIANSANVPNISSANIYDINTYSPFWLQGDPAIGQ
jgi:hypothetical protein